MPTVDEVCVVTVTYGDRAHLLKRVVERCLEEGVKKVVIVDNASHGKSREIIPTLPKTYNNVVVISLRENTGSAGGYKRGLEYVYNDAECKYVWLLDDDNLPTRGALQALLRAYNEINHPHKEHKVALASAREQPLHVLRREIKEGIPTRVLRKNAFLGFNIMYLLPRKIFSMLNMSLSASCIKTMGAHIVRRPYAPYGGLFFHKSLIDTIGYPDERFYLYADDTEWTYRITCKGGAIYMVLSSIVLDIDDENRQRRTLRGLPLSAARFYVFMPEWKLYYTVRNRVYLERTNFMDNSLLYFFNRRLLLLLFRLILCDKKYAIAKEVVRDGMGRVLGRKYVVC
ncbi:MAG: glycosyltransferase [Pyrobaculum sp.]